MIATLQFQPRRAIRGRGFTLVEMLAVIAVIVILIVAGGALLGDPAQSARLAARDILRGHLQQARGHAIASNRPTAMIIAGYGAGTSMDGRMLTIAEVEPKDEGGIGFRATRLVQRWTPLPESMFFLDRAASGSAQATLLDSPAVIEAEYQKKPVTCHGLVFSPDGRISVPADGTPMLVAIGRGAATAGGGVVATQKSGDSVVFDFLRINRLNARARLLDPRTAP